MLYVEPNLITCCPGPFYLLVSSIAGNAPCVYLPNTAKYATYSLQSDNVGMRAVYTCMQGYYWATWNLDSSLVCVNGHWPVRMPDCLRECLPYKDCLTMIELLILKESSAESLIHKS